VRAVVIRKFSDPKQLKVEEVPTPEPAPGEVLVEISAASINPSDVKNVTGHMRRTSLPRIPGRDFAGVVVQGPTDLVGREVFGTGGDVGFTRDGSHAQFIAVPAAAAIPKPPALSMEAAGLAGLTFVTAWSAIFVSAQIKAGETVLIIGAAGGVGSAAVQIAAWRGATVIGAVRSADDVPAAQENGARYVTNTRSENLVEFVRKTTGERGADVVFDSSGMMFDQAVEAAANDARIPVIAAPADGQATFNLRALYRKQLRIHGIDTVQLDAIACAKLLAEMLPGFQSRRLRVAPGRSCPLAEAAEAYEEASRGGARVVLRPDL
jgi:NADPH:quinone reductase-like Zn-dependent oxidoreductase